MDPSRLSQLRALRDDIEQELLALQCAIEGQCPPQWWEGSPATTNLVERSTELLMHLAAVNNELSGLRTSPESDQG